MTRKQIKLKHDVFASDKGSVTAFLTLSKLWYDGYLYFGNLFRNSMIPCIMIQIFSNRSATNLLSTQLVAQKCMFELVTTSKPSCRTGESCSKWNPPVRVSFIPQDVVSTPDRIAPLTDWRLHVSVNERKKNIFVSFLF